LSSGFSVAVKLLSYPEQARESADFSLLLFFRWYYGWPFRV